MHSRACHRRPGGPAHSNASSILVEDVDKAAEHDGNVRPLLVVGPMWVESWLAGLSEIEPLSYEFVDCQELVEGEAWFQKSGGATAKKVEKRMGVQIATVLVEHSFPAYAFIITSHQPPPSSWPESGGKGEGFKLVYSGDTRPCTALVAAGHDAHLLIHEATHPDDNKEKAIADRHCTVEEAVEVAVSMGARYSIFTHLSSRFEKSLPDLSKYGNQTVSMAVAVDGLTVPMNRVPELPLASLQAAKQLADEYGEEDEVDDVA